MYSFYKCECKYVIVNVNQLKSIIIYCHCQTQWAWSASPWRSCTRQRVISSPLKPPQVGGQKVVHLTRGPQINKHFHARGGGAEKKDICILYCYILIYLWLRNILSFVQQRRRGVPWQADWGGGQHELTDGLRHRHIQVILMNYVFTVGT